MSTKIGIAGLGAIGSAVADAVLSGINGIELHAVSELEVPEKFEAIPNLSFDELAKNCDLIIECLPPDQVFNLAKIVMDHGKDLIIISASALLMFPELLEHHHRSDSRIIMPSGALVGLDGVKALKLLGITSAKIKTTKKPAGFSGAPFVVNNKIDLDAINAPQVLFEGNAIEASKNFPANVNVAATLSFAGIGPEKTRVEIVADPNARGNTHEIDVKSDYSHIQARVENLPDPKNPKSSVLAAQSIVSILKGMNESFVVL